MYICILQIIWYDFITKCSVREQTKLVDLPLVVADRRHAILGHIIRLSEETPAHTVLSVSQKAVILQQTGSVHQIDHGKHGYLVQQVIADQDCDIDVIWWQARDCSTWRLLRP